MIKNSLLRIILLIWLSAGVSYGQTLSNDVQRQFNQGIEAYEQLDFENAAEIFLPIGIPESYLFAGKSYYALGRYQSAIQALQDARKNAPSEIYHEAGYTLALAHLNSRRIAPAFDILDEIISEFGDTSLNERARELFEEFNQFLLPKDRIKAVRESQRQSVKDTLLTYGVKHSSREDGNYFIQEAVQMGLPPELITKLNRNLTYLIDNVEFKPKVPNGFVYNIGVLLPQQEHGTPLYNVSRELYYGMLMAIEQFNSDQDEVRVALNVVEKKDEEDVEVLFKSLVEDYQSDIIFGPLFSDDAAAVAELSKQNVIPVIAPLANSDEIAGNSSYFFQANPTFATRGRVMADIAMDKLGYDSLAVMVDRNSTGAVEARAFRERIEEKGGEMVHYFDIDFHSRRFDVSDYTQFFAGTTDILEDSTITLRNVDAVFMPFTGSAAKTMIDIVLTDLQAFRSRVSIIGTEEWGLNRISLDAISRFNIVYSGIFDREMNSEAAQEFLAQYIDRFGHEPELFAIHGYDNAQFILEAMRSAIHPSSLADEYRSMPEFKGIGQRIFYNETQVNQAIEARLLSSSGYLLIE